jgi:carbonic anhydrase
VVEIRKATGAADHETARDLFREYAAWLAVDLCFQDFGTEVARLEEIYGPPGGVLLLAAAGAGVAGCVGVRPLAGGFAEMKRLYVRPEHRGLGIGRLLARAAVDEARRLGYRRMLLDTLPARMPEAAALYASLGFRPAGRYYENPLPGVEYLELVLDR